MSIREKRYKLLKKKHPLVGHFRKAKAQGTCHELQFQN